MISGIYEQFGQIRQGGDGAGQDRPDLAALLAGPPAHRHARRAGRPFRARRCAGCTALVAEKPERIDAALALADLMRMKERFADAVQRLRHRRAAPQESRRALLADLFRPRHRRWSGSSNGAKAEADMKKALELSPDQPYVLNYLGYSWIDQGMNLDEGMKMLKRATELRPDDGAVTDSVGWAYYRLGQFDTRGRLARAGERAEGRRLHGRRASRRRLLACRPVARGAFRVASARSTRIPRRIASPVIQDKLANGLNASNDKPTVYEKAADKK